MMGQRVDEIMTKDLVMVPTSASVVEAARKMHAHAIGDVLVVDGDRLFGLVTDRDIVTRVVAEDLPGSTPIGDISSEKPVKLQPDQEVGDAVALMRAHDVRRLPVVDDDGRPVGIVTLGDLAKAQDPQSALADISAAPPQQD